MTIHIYIHTYTIILVVALPVFSANTPLCDSDEVILSIWHRLVSISLKVSIDLTLGPY